jgi:hypothetical protein
VLGFLVAQLLEQRTYVGLGYVRERFLTTAESLLLRVQRHPVGLERRHVPAHVADVRRLDVEDVVERDPRRLVAEEGEPPLRKLRAVLLLVDRHGAEHRARVVAGSAIRMNLRLTETPTGGGGQRNVEVKHRRRFAGDPPHGQKGR